MSRCRCSPGAGVWPTTSPSTEAARRQLEHRPVPEVSQEQPAGDQQTNTTELVYRREPRPVGQIMDRVFSS